MQLQSVFVLASAQKLVHIRHMLMNARNAAPEIDYNSKLNLVLLRNCLHARDVAPLRWGRRPLPWSKLIVAAPEVAKLLPEVAGGAAVRDFYYVCSRTKLANGVYRQAARQIMVDLGQLQENDSPQSVAVLVLHEMAHALLHAESQRFNRDQEVYAECQAELTAITATWLMGYQLPADAFRLIRELTDDEPARRAYHALIDYCFELDILPAAQELVKAFHQVGV